MVATAIHANLVGIELHDSKLRIVNGTPNVAPSYAGQTQYDEDNNILYIATGVSTAADWKSQSSVTKIIDKSAGTYSVLSTDNGYILSMTNTGARTITLPATPIGNFYIGIHDGAGTASTGNITVNAGSNIFQDGNPTFKITSDTSTFIFVFDTTVSTWVIASSFIGYQPVVSSIIGRLGGDLTLGTVDTSDVLINVNSVNAIDVSTTAIDFKLGGVSKLNLGATNLEVKKTLLLDDPADITKQLAFNISNSTTGTVTTFNTASTVDRTLTFPNITDTLVTKNTTDIFTNKSFNNLTTVLAGNSIKFNNSANTFGTSILGGNNTGDLSLTLPTTAPLAGQAIVATTTGGVLGWASVTESQQYITTSGNITALANTTSSVIINAAAPANIRGITAGGAGQEITITNITSNLVTLYHLDGTAPLANQIVIPNGNNLFIPANFSIRLAYNATATVWQIVSQIYAPNIQGSSSGIAPQAGCIGEQKTNVTPNFSSVGLTASTWGVLQSLTLGIGCWNIKASTTVTYTVSGIPANLDTYVGVNTSAPSGDAILGYNYKRISFVPSTSGVTLSENIDWVINVTTSTTFNFCAQTANTATASGQMIAIRLS